MTPTDNNGNGELGPETVAELHRLARSRPRSGREAVAKASAIRTLERLSRERRRQEVPPMPEGFYPHEEKEGGSVGPRVTLVEASRLGGNGGRPIYLATTLPVGAAGPPNRCHPRRRALWP